MTPRPTVVLDDGRRRFQLMPGQAVVLAPYDDAVAVRLELDVDGHLALTGVAGPEPAADYVTLDRRVAVTIEG